MLRNLSLTLCTSFFLTGTIPAKAYDMDCAILLCMAGGFPESAVCAAAHTEMIRRVTPWPSKPPFGVCSYSASSETPSAGAIRRQYTAIPDFAWLERTRVIWWSGWSVEDAQKARRWTWRIRSCEADSKDCKLLSSGHRRHSPWPKEFITENGQSIASPVLADHGPVRSRGIILEYSDIDGKMSHSDWIRY
ncbi:hypothetical protein [Litoreibacter roseus]|uniref:hypothetical protein n=1 Tax=Litoreibacter roseus TaxID=2601869 RepID=UPI00135B67CB|nr:hypothetical protein [Litoreibacter roseus]